MSTQAGSPRRTSMWRAHRAAAVWKPLLMGYVAAAAAFAFLGASPAVGAKQERGDFVADRIDGPARGSTHSDGAAKREPRLANRSGDCIGNDARCIAEQDPSPKLSIEALPTIEAPGASAGR